MIVYLLLQTRLAEITADNDKYVEMKVAYDKEKQIRHIQVSPSIMSAVIDVFTWSVVTMFGRFGTKVLQ